MTEWRSSGLSSSQAKELQSVVVGIIQKKDTHTLDFDVTWLSWPAFFAKRQFWVVPIDFL
jgi:hypothetical protein